MNEIGKGGGKGHIHDVDNGTHEQMLGAREAHAHTKDNDSYVYRAKSAEFIRILEKAVLALFDKSCKERLKAMYELCSRNRDKWLVAHV